MLSRRKFLNTLGQSALLTVAVPSLATAGTSEQQQTQMKSFTILFQGDSITDGNRGRSEDPNHIMGHGYAFSIASRLGADYPARNLKFINKGISGNTILDLAARWKEDAIDLNPDVVSILVGVNDVYFHLNDKTTLPAYDFEDAYRKLLTTTRENLPGVLLVLGEPFVLPVGMVKDNLGPWMDEIKPKQETVKKLAKEFDAVLVNYQQVFIEACKKASPDYWIWDGIHPTVAGHELMAREWIAQVSKRLPVITSRYSSK